MRCIRVLLNAKPRKGALLAHDPEKWCPVFGPRSCAKQKGKAERRKAHVLLMSAPQTSLRSLRNSSVRGVRAVYSRARLPALTLAALATGYYPDGSAPEPGFPRRWLTGILPASRKSTAVKHAPCGPVFLPADRGPEAAREREGRTPARGHRISLTSVASPVDVP
jgi:hypothetical protein